MTVELGSAVGPTLAFIGAMLALAVNGDRAERQRRRELHGRALAAVLDYGEMPFMIRRRRVEIQERSAERIRLSDRFSATKAAIQTCQVLLAADGDDALARAYDELVEIARGTAGVEASQAWKEEPVENDEEMNMGELHDRLTPFRDRLGYFELELARATLPRRKRLLRWMNGKDLEALTTTAEARTDAELGPGKGRRR